MDFLRTLLDGMATAEDSCTEPETHFVLKGFIRQVAAYVAGNSSGQRVAPRKVAGRRASCHLELLENPERLEHALKNIQICASDASEVAEICKRSLSGEFYP